MKWYGSTNEPAVPTRDGDDDDDNNGGDSYAAPLQHHGRNRSTSSSRLSLPRTESSGGATVDTPLLGEKLLSGIDLYDLSEEDDDGEGIASPRSGAGAIEGAGVVGGDRDEENPRTSSTGPRPPGEDPRSPIGLSVGLVSKGKSGGAREGPPYKSVCLGLAVGIGLCSIVLLAFMEYNHHYHHHDVPSKKDANVNSSSLEVTRRGVPFPTISRDSFGDPVSNILDISLFHPSLLFGGQSVTEKEEGKKSVVASAATKTNAGTNKTNNDTSGGDSPKPFLRVPFPTGAFWTNLVLLPPKAQSATIDDNQYSYPVVAYPYSYQWSPLGKLQASYSASRRVVGPKSIIDGFAPDITVGSVEGIRARQVVRFDSLSVTLRFYSGSGTPNDDDGSGGSSGGNWETYIVQGSPYITAKYSGLAPELRALSDFDDIACPPTFKGEDPAQFRQREETQGEGDPPTTASKKLGICAVTTASSRRKKIITGVQFVVTTKERLRWLVFASEPITFQFDLAGSRRTIRSAEPYGGVVRLALIPPPSSAAAALDFDGLASSPGVKRLIYHAGTYPVGGAVSWDFRSGALAPLAASMLHHSSQNASSRRTSAAAAGAATSEENNIGRVTFAFDAVRATSSSPNAGVPLLTLCLPHHAASISSAEELLLRSEEFDLDYRSIKGRMVPVVGNAWSYEEELTSVGFGDGSLLAGKDATRRPAPSPTAGGGAASSHREKLSESMAISTLDQSVRDLLLQTVESDIGINPPVLAYGAYGFGKQIARLAQLAHIAGVVDAANARRADAPANRTTTAENGSGGGRTAHRARALLDKYLAPTTTTKTKTITTTTTTTTTMDAESGSSGGGTARRACALLEKYLAAWLAGDGDGGRPHLSYDAELGGILSEEGTRDVHADFGNARYNDHHFHYGYVLYAAAVLGRADPGFVARLGPRVDALFRDVAHEGHHDGAPGGRHAPLFPLARHKSWFDGHSFASGLFPFADGKSQESSSEAVNCYYGAYLWSRVRWGDRDGGDRGRETTDFARLLLATEVTGAKTYWHMAPPGGSADDGSGTTTSASGAGDTAATLVPAAYDEPVFRENYMVGNLGMTDATCTTWFGNKSIYVHLINFLPVTAITAELFEKEYVKGERSVLSNNDSVEYAWKGYSICNEAILDPNNAWIEGLSLISNQLDPGLSKSQVLFWASTRESFSSGTIAEVVSPNKNGHQQLDDGALPSNDSNYDGAATTKFATNKGHINSSSASCTSHENCVAANVQGSCCPTNEGVFLECCT